MTYYKQHLKDCLKDDLVQAAYQSMLIDAEDALSSLKQEHDAHALSLLRLQLPAHEWSELLRVGKHLRDSFKHLVVVGTGGATLCSQALVGMKPGHHVHFFDMLDPYLIDHFFKHLPLKDTAFLIVSKSGKTIQTLAQAMLCMERLEKVVDKSKVKEHLFYITDPTESPLRSLAGHTGGVVLNHAPVCGRFSIFTSVGLIPALFAGLNVEKILEGAESVLQGHFLGTNMDAVQASAVIVALMQQDIRMLIMMPYHDFFDGFSMWYRQIWAESLGKTVHSTTPLLSRGTQDQHSQLQLYLDGPRDKLFTIVSLPMEGKGKKLPTLDIRHPMMDQISEKTSGDILHIEHQTTVQMLKDYQRPVRLIELAKVEEACWGGIAMHMILETLITAGMLDVHPFNQPAVDKGKALIQRLLDKTAPK